MTEKKKLIPSHPQQAAQQAVQQAVRTAVDRIVGRIAVAPRSWPIDHIHTLADRLPLAAPPRGRGRGRQEQQQAQGVCWQKQAHAWTPRT